MVLFDRLHNLEGNGIGWELSCLALEALILNQCLLVQLQIRHKTRTCNSALFLAAIVSVKVSKFSNYLD